MDRRECFLTDISGKSARDLSPSVTLNQIFQTEQCPDGFVCMDSGSVGQNLCHRAEQTSQEFWPPQAAVQHQGVYRGGLRSAENGPEGHCWRCERYQCGAAGATARNPAA